VVFKSKLEQEEFQEDAYTEFTIDLKHLPWYFENRKSVKGIPQDAPSLRAQVKEMLIAASLIDRFVKVFIPKPDDPELYEILKKDIELLTDELGCIYYTSPQGVTCIFKFPYTDMKTLASRGKAAALEALQLIKHFIQTVRGRGYEGAKGEISELVYGLERAEIHMDEIYANTINVAWDLPQTECIGYFLLTHLCEELVDELTTIALETHKILEMTDAKDVISKQTGEDLFKYIWLQCIDEPVNFCENALNTITPDNRAGTRSRISETLELIQNRYTYFEKYRHRQYEVLKLFSDPRATIRATSLMKASYHLYKIQQTAERLVDLASGIAKKSLYTNISTKPRE
jgi:hypothetical protein